MSCRQPTLDFLESGQHREPKRKTGEPKLDLVVPETESHDIDKPDRGRIASPQRQFAPLDDSSGMKPVPERPPLG